MKIYKVKSFIYLSCFIAVAAFYQNLQIENTFQKKMYSSEMAETEFENAASPNSKRLEEANLSYH